MGARRAPFIAVETDLTKDERPALIADLGGYNVYEARGRLITLWSWCADRRLRDAPDDCDGYAVPDAVVRRFLGPQGVRGILGDGCDELALGQLRPDGLIYLRGTSETVASFRALRSWASAGGNARRGSPRDAQGHFATSQNSNTESVIETTDVQREHQPLASREPAVASVDPRSQIPDPRSQTGDLGSATSSLTPSTDSTPATEPSPKRSRAQRAERMPAEWAPRSEELALARSLGVDPTGELASFSDHHSAKGSRFVDWNAAFRTWLRNAVKFRRVGSAPRGNASFFDVIDQLPPPREVRS